MSLEKKKIGEIVADLPAAGRIFERLRIDSCCGGYRALDEVCAERGLDLKKVVAELEGASQLPAEHSETNWLHQALFTLISHIVNKHHAFVKEQAPRRRQVLAKNARCHRGSAGTIFRLTEGRVRHHHPPAQRGKSPIRPITATKLIAGRFAFPMV